MTAVFASFAAWLFPSFGVLRKGFDNPSRLNIDAFVVLACWYTLIFLSFVIGEKFGELLGPGVAPRKPRLLDLNSNTIYYSFTVLCGVGIGMTLIVIFRSLSFQQALIFIALGEANSLKEALYEGY